MREEEQSETALLKKKQTVISCYINQTYFFGLLFLCVLIVAARRHLFCRSARAALPLPACIPRHWHFGMSARCRPLAGAVASPAFTHSVGAYVENTCKRQSQTSAVQFKSLCCCLIVSDAFFSLELKQQQWKRSHLQRRS